VAASDDMLLIAYIRIASGARRAFVREFANPPPRRRGVRH
jgi:hypothetical protein